MRPWPRGRARDQGFDDFVAARWPALFGFACLLTSGDRHRAEDAVQEALVKLWFAWPKVAEQQPEAYVRKVLTRALARSARRRWWGERPSENLPEPRPQAEATGVVDERARLEQALALLPVRQRTAVVLRYYCDMSDRQVAEMMDCAVGTASSLASRGVARLRGILTDAPSEPVR